MNAYLFDVDGVIANIQTGKITQSDMIPLLVSLLAKGMPMGFISGRGMLWLRSTVVKVIENYFNDHPGFDKHILDNVFVAGEFGGVICVHKNGVREESINKGFIIPEEVQRGLHLVAFEYGDDIFVEKEKQTIFTAVRKQEVTDKEFQIRKKSIIEEFQNILSPFLDLEAQSDRTAINIRHKKANKSYTTDLFISWLKEKGITPEKYFVFGDSPTDLEMGEELHKQQLPFAFIYVGEQSEIANLSLTFSVTFTKELCDKGTIEYLKGISNF